MIRAVPKWARRSPSPILPRCSPASTTASSFGALPRRTWRPSEGWCWRRSAENSSVPVWNGLTTEWHPTQMIADIMTVQEHFGHDNIKGKTLVFMGDAKNNVARSLMVVCAKMGMNFVACGPASCMPSLMPFCRAASIF